RSDLTPRARPGLPAFLILLSAQAVTLLGSRTSEFALALWFYRRTGLVTLNGLLIAASLGPEIGLAPLAGVLVDRFDRARVLLAGQLGAGLCAAALLASAV